MDFVFPSIFGESRITIPAAGSKWVLLARFGHAERCIIPSVTKEPQDQSNRKRSFSWWIVPLAAVIVGVNIWYDYYHPLGIVFDVLLLALIIASWVERARR
jgi:hypothetical protein